jgi:hypothetical protein
VIEERKHLRNNVKTIYCNKNVDIQISAHDAFLGKFTSDILKVKSLESQNNIKVFVSKKTKGQTG